MKPTKIKVGDHIIIIIDEDPQSYEYNCEIVGIKSNPVKIFKSQKECLNWAHREIMFYLNDIIRGLNELGEQLFEFGNDEKIIRDSEFLDRTPLQSDAYTRGEDYMFNYLINKFNQIMDGDYSDNVGKKYTDYSKTIKRFENIHRLLKQNNLEEPGNE